MDNLPLNGVSSCPNQRRYIISSPLIKTAIQLGRTVENQKGTGENPHLRWYHSGRTIPVSVIPKSEVSLLPGVSFGGTGRVYDRLPFLYTGPTTSSSVTHSQCWNLS